MTSPVAVSSSNNNLLSGYLATQAQQQAANASTSSSSGSGATSASMSVTWGNFNTYLNILTTQLKNQDPTNATDPNQFTQELVQFAGVEQQLSTNSKLDTLINYAKNGNGATAALSYIGQYAQVQTTAGQMALQGGSSEIGYTLDSASASTNVYVKDSTGKVVATLAGGTGAGTNFVNWDGKNSSGAQLPDGTYSFNISATNSNGTAQTPSTTYIIGKVTGVASNSDGTANIDVGNLSFATSAVNAVYSAGNQPGAKTTTTTGAGGSSS